MSCSIHAAFECSHIEAQGLSVPAPWLEGSLVLEESVVHLPVHSLVASAMSGFSGLESLLVNPLEWHIQGDVTDLAAIYELGGNLRGRLTDVPGAVWSLIVRELDQRELGRARAFDRIVADVEDPVLDVGAGRRGGASLEQGLDLLLLPLDLL